MTTWEKVVESNQKVAKWESVMDLPLGKEKLCYKAVAEIRKRISSPLSAIVLSNVRGDYHSKYVSDCLDVISSFNCSLGNLLEEGAKIVGTFEA